MDELSLNDYCDEDEFIDLNKQKWYELSYYVKSVIIHEYNRDYEKFFEDYNLTFDQMFDLSEEDYNNAMMNWQGEVFVDGHLVHIIDFVEK